MDLPEDLSVEAVAAALPGRPVRTYPALLSTHADALAWARAGAPAGAVVVAGYQASPRGRGGLEWTAAPGESLGFSLVLRPRLSARREGWLYTVATSGLADAIGRDAAIAWPDEVHDGGRRAGAVSVHAELAPASVEWAVVSVLVERVRPPRAPVLSETVAAIETRAGATTAAVLSDYLIRCETLGRQVRARLIPLGPAGVQVSGRAATVLTDGALVIETATGRRIAVRAQGLGFLDVLD